MARKTRSAFISNSEFGTSLILPSFHSTRQAISFSTLPPLPSKRLVATAQSRSQPSSCEDEVRSLVGQYGQTSGLFSCSGGCGISSNWATEAAPWRFEVPTQSEPVSPPPITTTCLPVALIWSLSLSPALTLFCSGRKSMAKCTPFSSRPGTGKSRGCSAPPAMMTASNSFSRSSGKMVSLAQLFTWAGKSLPTSTLVRKTTPSASICFTRKSMCDFSILKSGMP